MAGKPSKPMTPFDKSVTPSYLYKLKLFLSFLPPSTQRFLAVYIKFSYSGIRWIISADCRFMHFLFNLSVNSHPIWMKTNGI